MSEREAALCTYSEYRLRLEGFERKEQQEWERLRWQTWQLMTPHYKKGQAPRTAKAFCKFPWDTQMSEADAIKAYERSRVTDEEARVLNEHFKRLFGDKFKTGEQWES